MRGGWCTHVSTLALLVSAVTTAVAHAQTPGTWSRPTVEGDGEATNTVAGSLAAERGRAPADRWMQRAWQALRSEGWMWAEIAADSSQGARLRLRLREGPRARLGSVHIECEVPELARRAAEAAGLREGSLLRPAAWPERLRRGLRAVAERGHPFASLSVVRREADPATGRIDLELLLVPGEPTRIGAVTVDGATHTRARVLARMSGLAPGQLFRESDLRAAQQRLEARAIVEAVDGAEVLRRPGRPGEVEVQLRVRQPRTLGSVSAALGLVRREDEESRISGAVDVLLMDLFGTARRFEGRWLDDGVSRRRLDLAYTEPLVLGSPLDLRLAVGQRHEDDLYDTVLGELGVSMAWAGSRQLELGVGVDRSTFAGETGRVRVRTRLGAELGVRHGRPFDAGLYGSVRTGAEAARVRETFELEPGREGARESTTQTLLRADGRLGLALTGRIALEGRVAWRSVETDRLPVPRTEQWALGGATTVRGYREDQFLGERMAWGGLELVLGPPRRGQGYAFFDLGWVRQTSLATAGTLSADEEWLRGFGLGLRSPTALGAIDLSVGFAERFEFDRGKLHIALTRSF